MTNKNLLKKHIRLLRRAQRINCDHWMQWLFEAEKLC